MYSVQSVADLSKRHSGNMSVRRCGFNVWHTVAKGGAFLVRKFSWKLFTTGKTKKKVTGFTSKAGNVFDTCLKFENDQISFDFDNPGEEEVQRQGR